MPPSAIASDPASIWTRRVSLAPSASDEIPVGRTRGLGVCAIDCQRAGDIDGDASRGAGRCKRGTANGAVLVLMDKDPGVTAMSPALPAPRKTNEAMPVG